MKTLQQASLSGLIRKSIAYGVLGSALCGGVSLAQTAAPAAGTTASSAAARQLGTVKSINASSITLEVKSGATVTVPVAAGATVLQLPPGSTDLKAATPAVMADIAVGDRVVTGKAGDTETASRVIVMKSTAIAARQASQQAEWQAHGSSGLVKAVDGSTLTMSSGPRTWKVTTTPQTIVRRYADDSVKFEDAKAGTLDQIRAGDQISVRGQRSEAAGDPTIAADEIVTGAFTNLSGLLASVDPASSTITLKDLTTKKMVTVKVTGNSDLRRLPPEAAAAFAARQRPGAAAAAGGATTATATGGARPAGAPGSGAPGSGGSGSSGAGTGGAAAGGMARGAGDTAGGGARRAGLDLSRMLARLPAESVTDLHTGEAVMIVASGRGDAYTTITLLSGVEPILSATPSGGQPITLSPWNLGAPDAAGGSQ